MVDGTETYAGRRTNQWLSSRAVTDQQITDAVLTSLRESPTLNTPTLIAGGAHVPAGTAPDDVAVVLDRLVAEGVVKHRPTGWKLAPEHA